MRLRLILDIDEPIGLDLQKFQRYLNDKLAREWLYEFNVVHSCIETDISQYLGESVKLDQENCPIRINVV